MDKYLRLAVMFLLSLQLLATRKERRTFERNHEYFHAQALEEMEAAILKLRTELAIGMRGAKLWGSLLIIEAFVSSPGTWLTDRAKELHEQNVKEAEEARHG